MLISKSLPDRILNKPIVYIATLEDKNVTLRQHSSLTDVTRVRFPNLVVFNWNKICCLFSSLLGGFSVYPPIAVTILLNCHMTSRQGAKTHCVDVPLINSVNRRMDRWMDGLINLHPNISMYILQTVLHTLPKVLTRRICLTTKSSFSW